MKNSTKKVALSVLVASTLMLGGCGETGQELYLQAQALELEANNNGTSLAEALKTYESAADTGSVEAALYLTKYYYKDRQFDKVVKYSALLSIEKPAEFAYYNGVMFLYGEGLSKNIEKGRDLLISADNANMPLAAYELGEYYRVNGDYIKAKNFYNKALAVGDNRALIPLASIYILDYIEPASEEDAFKLITLAEKLYPNDKEAALLLTTCYLEGFGTATDLKLAEQTLKPYLSDRKDDDVEYLYAKLRLYTGTQSSEAEGLALLKKLAVQNHYPRAAYDLYEYHKLGLYGAKKSPKEAIYYARIAKEGRLLKAYIALANIYLDGDGVEVNPIDSFNFAKSAYEMAPYSRDAVFLLGKLYAEGIGTERNDELGFKLINEAAALGVADADVLKAIMLYTGRAASKDPKEALNIFKKRAEEGNEIASYYYGVMLYEGTGIEKNLKDAIYYLEKAVHTGMHDAIYTLALAYDESGDTTEAIKSYEQLTKTQNPYTAEANARLGEIYVSLDNTDKGIFYYETAAKLGHKAAIFNLADIYYQRKQYKKALGFLHKIAKTVPMAAAYIGFMYQEGVGVDKSEIKALDWYDKGISMGSADAYYYKAALLTFGKDVPDHERDEAPELFIKAACLKNEEAALYLGTKSKQFSNKEEVKIGWLVFAELYNQSSRAHAVLKNLGVTDEQRQTSLAKIKNICNN